MKMEEPGNEVYMRLMFREAVGDTGGVAHLCFFTIRHTLVVEVQVGAVFRWKSFTVTYTAEARDSQTMGRWCTVRRQTIEHSR